MTPLLPAELPAMTRSLAVVLLAMTPLPPISLRYFIDDKSDLILEFLVAFPINFDKKNYEIVDKTYLPES